MSAELWAVVGTVAGTILFLVVPGVLVAWYILEIWIGGKPSYEHILQEDDKAR